MIASGTAARAGPPVADAWLEAEAWQEREAWLEVEPALAAILCLEARELAALVGLWLGAAFAEESFGRA